MREYRNNSYRKHKKSLFEEMNGRCGYCGCELDYNKATIDHKIPLGLGGNNDKENLIISCWSCNHYKHRRDIEMFRNSIKNTVKQLKHNSTYRLAYKYNRLYEADIETEIKFYFEKRGII